MDSQAQPAVVQKHAGPICIALLAFASILSQAVHAEPATTAADAGAISIELNKLEAQGSQCRAYFVVTNKNAANYQELKLDLVLFRPDGVIGRRFAVDLAPLKSNKRTVKLFEQNPDGLWTLTIDQNVYIPGGAEVTVKNLDTGLFVGGPATSDGSFMSQPFFGNIGDIMPANIEELMRCIKEAMYWL